LNEIGISNEKDTVIQMARCSFDMHIQDIAGTLVAGATLVMLHPQGNVDLKYVAEVLSKKHISYMLVVPTLLESLLYWLKGRNEVSGMKSLRSVCCGG